MSEYISAADTAKLVRQALKKTFPCVKFSVRTSTYSGGASIDVSWFDGPSTKAVESVAKVYSGSGFDGMIDLKYGISHWLKDDGSVIVADNPGTYANGGSDPDYSNPAPAGARRVRFLADFIFCNRDYTPEVVQPVLDKLCKKWGFDPVRAVSGKYGLNYEGNINQYQKPWNGVDLATMLHRELQEIDFTEKKKGAAATTPQPPSGPPPINHRINETITQTAVHFNIDWFNGA